ncbi:MAG: hypothetical protein KIH01_02045 [Candidatus Freyarchaeota archaeon]|nr:hypothetical protein [Candidatus Jordarchaeia archaeon]
MVLDERSVRIALPLGVARYYVLTFISFLDGVEAAIYGDHVDVRTVAGSVAERLAEGMSVAARALKKYNERWKGVEVPASGNDKKIFVSLMRHLLPSEEGTFFNALVAYSRRLRGYRPQDLAASFSRFGEGDFSLPSIFKPEHYALSRVPFMRGKERYDVKVNLDYFMLLLAGYVLSRVGRVMYEAGGGRREWHTLHVLPYDLGASPTRFSEIVKCLSQEGGWSLPPGLNPEEACMLWLAMTAPDDAPDVILMSMKDPRGTEAAKIGVSYYLPLKSFIAKSGRALMKIRKDERMADLLRRLLQKALKPAVADKAHDRAVELVKLLFIALQGGELERAELLLRASRIEAMKVSEEKKDEYWVVHWGRVLAEKIAQR